MSLRNPILLILALISATISSSQIITTVAGNGTYGYSGNGGPATSAQLAWLIGVTTDNAGNFYISDHDNNVVRKVNSAGIISDYAGNHLLGNSDDGGPATSAQLYHPAWLTFDNTGNLYFTDQNSEIIRKVTPAGIISTITGFLPSGYSGDGGPIISASFRSISGIAFDNVGNMYISDYGNHVIRKVNTAGIITTIAGNGTSGSGGDGGPATSAQLANPYKVIFDNAGNMYIPDNGNQKIRRVTPAGIITTFAGTGVIGYSGDGGPAIAAQFRFPWSIDIDAANNIYVADAGNEVIRKIDAGGIITNFAGNGNSGYSGDGGPATAAEMSDICNVAVDNAGNVYITNRTPYYVVRKVNNCLTAVVTQQPVNVAICNSGPASFSIIANSFTSLQWQVNTGTGWNNITDGVNYSGTGTSNLNIATATPAMNGYQYRCAAVNGCATIYSLAALLNVTAPTTPSVSINTPATTICAGTNVVFTATPSNAGPSPAYQWIKNGTNVGNNNTSYTDNGLTNGDVISCVITSTSTCVTSNTATSNNVSMTVTPLVTPSLIITPSANNICYGTPVHFNYTLNNGGLSPQYTWFKNGVNLFWNSPSYSDDALNNGDIIMAAFTSSLACVTSAVAPSNEVLMIVTPLATPGVSITASSGSICKGTSVSFTATAINGGTSPIYQWKKNNVLVGGGGSVYTDNTIANGDALSCELTSNAGCLTSLTANSNVITMTLLPDPVVSLDHTNTLCTGDSRVLNAGNFPAYVWNDGSMGQTMLVNNTGTYYVTVTGNNGCKGSDTTKITTLLPLPSDFAPPDTAICSYGSLVLKAQPGYDYDWNSGSIASSISITQPGKYWLQVTDDNNCKATDTIIVIPKECMKGFYIPTAFTPNNDGKNDSFKPLLFGNVKQYSFTVYNRWGNVVFTTKELQRGWDGRFGEGEQDTNVFVWICTYQFEGEEVKREKGSVVVIR